MLARIARWFLILATVGPFFSGSSAAQHEPADETSAPVEMLVLGTFHFTGAPAFNDVRALGAGSCRLCGPAGARRMNQLLLPSRVCEQNVTIRRKRRGQETARGNPMAIRRLRPQFITTNVTGIVKSELRGACLVASVASDWILQEQ